MPYAMQIFQLVVAATLLLRCEFVLDLRYSCSRVCGCGKKSFQFLVALTTINFHWGDKFGNFPICHEQFDFVILLFVACSFLPGGGGGGAYVPNGKTDLLSTAYYFVEPSNCSIWDLNFSSFLNACMPFVFLLRKVILALQYRNFLTVVCLQRSHDESIATCQM